MTHVLALVVNFIKKDLNYLFYDEKLKEVSNIESFIKKLKKSSQNFFLIHKSFKNIEVQKGDVFNEESSSGENLKDSKNIIDLMN